LRFSFKSGTLPAVIERYSRAEMAALWGDTARYNTWLEIECLALEGMEQTGLVPVGSAATVRAKATVNPARIAELEAKSKHDVIAFLSQIQESANDPAAGFLHRGMTSNDLLDTAFAVTLGKAGELLLAECDKLAAIIRRRAKEHKNTVCIGRTHGIHAEPTTFGIKLAGWFAELSRGKERLTAALEGVRVGKLSGAVGTYSSLPPSVESFVLGKLGLSIETVPTQVVARDRHAAFFAALAGIATSIERWCVEIRHLQRTEVREVEEPFGAGQKGSSAMPHKRNPILCENLSGLARLVRSYSHAAFENVALWHERDISHSSVERVIAPDATILLDFMLARFSEVVAGMTVSPERMKANLELTGGLIFSSAVLTALIERGVARDEAYAIVQSHALAQALAGWGTGAQSSFKERLTSDPRVTAVLPKLELERLFDAGPMLKYLDGVFARSGV
jgi:adenylosuccinate lyase